MGRLAKTAAIAAGAAAAQYFLDPELGRTRRTRTKDRIAGMVRRPVRKAADQARKKAELMRDRTEGAIHETMRSPAQEWPENDPVLADKVRSEALGDDEWRSYQINVDAARGVVTLRGQVDRPHQIDELEERVRRVAGVRDVDNLLHLPDTEPANIADEVRPPRDL